MPDFELYINTNTILLCPQTPAAIIYSLANFQYWRDLFSIAIEPEAFEAVMDGIEAHGLTVEAM